MSQVATATITPEVRIAFRSAQVQSNNVDLDSRTIKGVVLAEVGEAKGHGFHIELSALQKFMQSANKKYKEGLPSNYGHNWDNLGKNLGRISSLSISGNKLIGDLTFYKSADSSPQNPGMASYVMNMAKEDPKSLMLSIRFVPGEYYQYDKTGTRLRVRYYDDDWNWISPFKEFGNVYRDIEEAMCCDVVDDGALTTQMFSTSSFDRAFTYLASLPDFGKWVQNHVQDIPEINEFYASKQNSGLFAKIKSFFESKLQAMAETPKPEAPAAAPEQAPATETSQETQDTAVMSAITARLDALEKENKDLKDQLAQMSEEPAATPTSGAAQASATDKNMPAWMSDPLNQKAMSRFPNPQNPSK